ncbi:hypothetical protein D3C84_1217630 [compost metagenome]
MYMNDLRTIPAYPFDQEVSSGATYWHLSQTDSIKVVNDRLYYVILFDENLKEIGYVVIPVQYSNETVAEGYTPINTWKLAEIK